MRIMRALLIFAAICLAGAAWARETAPAPGDRAKIAAVDSLNEPAPIVVWNRTIAVLRAPYKNSTPADRARRAIARIEALPVRDDFEIIAIEVTTGDLSGFMVISKTEALFTLLEGDVKPGSGERIETVAQAAAAQLEAVLNEHAAQLKWSNLARAVGFSLMATLFYGLMIWALLRMKRSAMGKIAHRIAQWRHPLSLAGISLAPVLMSTGRAAANLSALAVVLPATYLWLTFCLAQFFYTRPLTDRLGEFLAGFLGNIAFGIIGATPGFLTVIVIFWLTRMSATGISRFFTGVEKGTISVSWLQPDSARASRRIVIACVWLFALTIAYPFIPGSGSDAFKGISVFAGLMLSLGSTGFINHLMSGLAIAYSGAMRAGDYVSVNDIEGTVQELGAMSVKIITPKKELVTVPNGVAISAHVNNYSRLAGKEGAIVSTTVTIGYDAPWRQVHALLINAAEQTPEIRKSPAPFVLQRSLSDFYVAYELRVRMDDPARRLPVLSALHAAIQDAFNEAGVQIMSPNFVSQPETAVLVPKSKWHALPAAPETPDTAAR